jgi:endonuclease/exonuclease/phosphatase family metal-dependent hydrolase
MAEREDGRIRLLTWNIHAGMGADRRYDLDRIVALLRRHDPDIMALQEIDSRGRGNQPPMAVLAEAFGGHAAEARTITAPDGHYGHALISRWPFTSVALHDLSMRRREPRTAIEADIATPAGPLHLAAVHLGLWPGERRVQGAKLARMARSGAGPMVMLGDFNEWSPKGPVRRMLASLLPGRTRIRSFPARYPLLVLDRIYCRPVDALTESWTDTTARAASDHLPIIADIRLAPAAG